MDEISKNQICGHITPFTSVVHNTTIGENMHYILFYINRSWEESELVTTLVMPNGTRINQTVEFSSIQHGKSLNVEYYGVQDPLKGIWAIEIKALNIPPDGEDYCVYTSQVSNRTTERIINNEKKISLIIYSPITESMMMKMVYSRS